jgi:C-terminal processing protease CtpA/Prc
VFAALALAAIASSARAEPVPAAGDRLVGLARVWAKAKFFHPYLAYKDIDWDAALVAAIPKVEAATSVAEYSAAVQGMLAVLHDPVTRMAATPAASPVVPSSEVWLSTVAAGIVKVRIAGFASDSSGFLGMEQKAAQVVQEAAKAAVLIIDLRTPRAFASGDVLEAFDAALPAIDEWPAERMLEHNGYATQEGATSGGYFSTFITTGAKFARSGRAHGASYVVFLADSHSVVPGVVFALQAAGRGTLVMRGALDEYHTVTTADIEIPGKLVAYIRIGELVWGTPAADVTVTSDAALEARGLAIAKAAAAARPRAQPRKPVALPAMRPRVDLDYADAPYPSREHRLLAGIRLWAVLDTFSPYRYLAPDWDDALREALPRLVEAPDVDAYRKALRLMAARFGDGHVSVFPAPGAPGKPRGFPAIATRLVERKLAVVRILDAAEAGKQGIAVGDVIETIDGVPAATALAAWRAEVSGSTDEARDQRTAGTVLAGDDGTAVRVGIRAADGKLHDATLTRAAANATARAADASGPHWKKLTGDIGYVDLRTLVVPEIATMFDELKTARAIVFDMRGYPNRTMWDLSARMNTRNAKYGAEFLRPQLLGWSDNREGDSRVRFLQAMLPLPSGGSTYTGKVVVLIDDRAVSQAEHTCLYLAEAAGPTFIGSPTHGANGDVTRMRLPGGLRLSFTGQEVRHLDGKQLQKVGIQPDIVVRPTLAGLRAGKDEVLDRALGYLASGK